MMSSLPHTDFGLVPATEEHKVIIENLMQYYIYDFSEYIDCEVDDNGLFAPYPYLNHYWTEPTFRFPYLIHQQQKNVGFALVRINTEMDNRYSIAEFFILKKYRRAGIGCAVALELFSKYKGNWEVHERENNIPAQLFWIKAIGMFTNGNFTDLFENGRRIQLFSSE